MNGEGHPLKKHPDISNPWQPQRSVAWSQQDRAALGLSTLSYRPAVTHKSDQPPMLSPRVKVRMRNLRATRSSREYSLILC